MSATIETTRRPTTAKPTPWITKDSLSVWTGLGIFALALSSLWAGREKSKILSPPVEGSNKTSLQRIGARLCLAIALSLFAAPLHAQFVYVANLSDNSVSGYTIDRSTGALTPIASSPFSTGTTFLSANATSVAVDPSGKFAYVVTFGSPVFATFFPSIPPAGPPSRPSPSAALRNTRSIRAPGR